MSASVGSEAADPNLTPLLDLVLQLIMFFMITVNFVRVDQFDDAIKLPVTTSAVAMDATAEDWVFLNLDANGKLVGTLSTFVLDTPERIKVHLMGEKAALERSAKARGKAGEIKIYIILRADKACKYGDVWKVLDSCQRAGFRFWQLRAMTKSAALRVPDRPWLAWARDAMGIPAARDTRSVTSSPRRPLSAAMPWCLIDYAGADVWRECRATRGGQCVMRKHAGNWRPSWRESGAHHHAHAGHVVPVARVFHHDISPLGAGGVSRGKPRCAASPTRRDPKCRDAGRRSFDRFPNDLHQDQR